MKTCIIYANCQGQAIGRILKTSEEFSREFDITYIVNHRFIGEKTELPIELLQKCDLFIYQPISKKRDIYCTLPEYPNGIANILPKSCTRIAFPYIFNDGARVMYDKGNDIIHKEPILELQKGGFLRDEILERFFAGQMHFGLRERFDESMKQLQEREEICDAVVSPFIKDHIKDRNIFFTQNHVSNEVLMVVVDKILEILIMPLIDYHEKQLLDLLRPITPYEISAGVTCCCAPQAGWESFYTEWIDKILNGQCTPCPDIYAAKLFQD